MNYQEAVTKALEGKVLFLPNFEGYFKWDYSRLLLIFNNEDYECLASLLDIKNRLDWYWII